MALHVAGDVLLSDLVEVASAGGAHLAQESADDRRVADDGLRCQPAFPSQMIVELLEYLFLRGDGRQCRRRDHARVPQHQQQPLKRRSITRLD